MVVAPVIVPARVRFLADQSTVVLLIFPEEYSVSQSAQTTPPEYLLYLYFISLVLYKNANCVPYALCLKKILDQPPPGTADVHGAFSYVTYEPSCAAS